MHPQDMEALDIQVFSPVVVSSGNHKIHANVLPEVNLDMSDVCFPFPHSSHLSIDPGA
jgi:hypothetical protein